MNPLEIVLLASSLLTVAAPVVAGVVTLIERYLEGKRPVSEGPKKITLTIGEGPSREVIETRSIQDLEQLLRERTEQ